ncbi:MAG TPA: hypothetical protein VNZ03_19830 [Terriglobales bacterium]|nr:hypothetical protein [Terriglobales bacterium]
MSLLRAWAFATAVLLFVATACAQTTSPDVPVSPADLIRAVVSSELNRQVDRSHWMYDAEKEEYGKKETKQVVQLREFSVARLTAINGQALLPAQQQEETERIEKLVSHAAEQQKLEEVQKKDAEQCQAFFKMIPDAFLFSYEGREGELIRVSFRPNPSFQPSSREAKVFHALEGEILIQAKERRLAGISGHLVEDVKFRGGLLGHLEKGGKFSVKRSEIGPDQWALTGMEVDMKGKALLLKTIAVQQKEYRHNFRKLADDLSVAEAANILNGRVTLAAIH